MIQNVVGGIGDSLKFGAKMLKDTVGKAVPISKLEKLGHIVVEEAGRRHCAICFFTWKPGREAAIINCGHELCARLRARVSI